MINKGALERAARQAKQSLQNKPGALSFGLLMTTPS
jgi:hypothetical protein